MCGGMSQDMYGGMSCGMEYEISSGIGSRMSLKCLHGMPP